MPADRIYLLVALDYFSKWIYNSFVEAANSSSVIGFRESIFKVEGPPVAIVTDNGLHFVSKQMEAFLRKFDVKHFQVALYSPSSNRLERANRFLKEGIQTALAANICGQISYKRKIGLHYFLSLHDRCHTFQGSMKREDNSRLMPDWFLIFSAGRCLDESRNVEGSDLMVRNRVAAKQLAQKLLHDSKHKVKDTHFDINDWVLIKKNVQSKQRGVQVFTSCACHKGQQTLCSTRWETVVEQG